MMSFSLERIPRKQTISIVVKTGKMTLCEIMKTMLGFWHNEINYRFRCTCNVLPFTSNIFVSVKK
jgi:hypothetical protein